MEAKQHTAVIKYGILCSLNIILCGSGKESFTDFCFFFNLSAEGEVKRNQSLSDAFCPEMLQVRKEENKRIELTLDLPST
jgi:hypothetical protein